MLHLENPYYLHQQKEILKKTLIRKKIVSHRREISIGLGITGLFNRSIEKQLHIIACQTSLIKGKKNA